MHERTLQLIQGGLFNSVHPDRVPVGKFDDMLNATVAEGVLEGGPRYGSLWERTGAHASDVGYGLTYAEFGGNAEYIAVIKKHGDTTATAFSINPSSGTWTEIAESVGMTVSGDAERDAWVFGQYDGWLYGMSSSAGAFMRLVGGGTGDENWKPFAPEVVFGGALTVTLERPAYPQHEWGPSTVGASDYSGGHSLTISATAEPDGTWLVNDGTYSDPVTAAFSFVFPEELDLSVVDSVYVQLRPTTSSPDIVVGGGTYDGDGVNNPDLWYFPDEDHTTAFDLTYANGKALIAGTRAVYLGSGWFHFDLSAMAATDRDRVRRHIVKIECDTWRPCSYTVGVFLGGREMFDVGGSEPATPYAYDYHDPVADVSTNATRAELAAGSLAGVTPVPGLPVGGAWVSLVGAANATLAAKGYTNVRFYRQATDGTDEWVLLGTLPNSGTPELVDHELESVVRSGTPVDVDFESFVQGLAPSTLAVWKQHLIIGNDRKLYFSFEGLPRMFLPEPDAEYIVPDDLVETAGRTLWLSQGRTEDVAAIVTEDVLFLFATRGGYAMLGDRAMDASPPRLLPDSRGPVSKLAAAGMDGGALVLASDGLHHYRVSRAFAFGSDSTHRREEVSASIRRSLAELVAESGLAHVVEHDGEVWVFRGERYLRLTRVTVATGEPEWESGDWPAVKAACAVQGRGLRLMLDDGGVVLVDKESTTDLGDPVDWSATTGWILTERERPTRVYWAGSGTPTLTVRWLDGNKTSGLVDEESYVLNPLQPWVKGISLKPGYRFQFEISGRCGRDVVTRLDVVQEMFET